MSIVLLNCILAFLEGLALIISPCILPILPIILSGSIQSGKKRPYGIIIGFIAVFVIFTLFSRKLVQISGIDLNIVRNISFILLFLFGVVMISNYLTEKFDLLTNGLANIGSSWKIFNQSNNGFFSGFLFGGLIGVVWTPCVGPIFAAVILQTVLQQNNLFGFFTLLSFSIGISIPMLAIVIFGREIINRFLFLKNRTIFLRRLLGYIIIVSVIYMAYANSIIAAIDKVMVKSLYSSNMIYTNTKNTESYLMPKIAGIAAWINSDPIKEEQLRNKVVLVDFWTYSCINCARTIPYLKELYEKYHDHGLVIIGIHSPEFEFEKDLSNVKHAVEDFGIKYPVALDNNFVTWQNYHNETWPAHYLIDQNGNVVYAHFGEGEYDVIENKIRSLLGMGSIQTSPAVAPITFQTPETYLGYYRIDRFNSQEFIKNDAIKKYSYPSELSVDAWALNGNWTISKQYIVANVPGSAIKIHFRAAKVYAVMGSVSNEPLQVQIFLNGKPAPKSIIKVKNHALYNVIEAIYPIEGTLEMIAQSSGLQIYTFTFG